jgi:rhodanese-related sulfurtransferase
MAEAKEDQAATQPDVDNQERRQSPQTMEATRVTVDEVSERMKRGEPFTFIDTRNPKAWGEADTKLPGAIRVPADEVEQHLEEIPRDRAVITYCT